MIKIKRGLNLPIAGAPEQRIEAARPVRTVAILGVDYVGMKPTMEVQEGDQVKLGQVLFTDKKTPGVKYTAPAAGKVIAINRGEKRVLQSVVIEVQESEEAVSFNKFEAADFSTLEREQVQQNLIDSGLWTALRTRPFSKVPAPGSVPHSIFVTAIDTHPLAADPALIIAEHQQAFVKGLEVLSTLTDNRVYVCKNPDAHIPMPAANSKVVGQAFDGPHPAGLAGTHIHFLDPVHEKKTVWSIGYQDVIAYGHLFMTGELLTERVIALGGPVVNKPRLLRTRLGASIDELLQDELNAGVEYRSISGSVFGGRTARGPLAYLGRYHNQISVLEEGNKREFMGWLSPGKERHSVLNIYLSKLTNNKLFRPSTSTNGSERAMVPVGAYEKVMPLDILPTQLLRSILVGDTETAMKLGVLELDEEDLALCTYVCPGKYEYGPILRENLTRIEIEG